MNQKDDSITQARTAVEAVLRALGIALVVSVDDANGPRASREEVIAAAVSLDPSELSAIFPELGEVPDDPDVLSKKIRDAWEELDANRREERGGAVLIAARRQDGSKTDDVADAILLSELVPAEQLVPLSPAQWEEQKERLLRESQEPDRRTLFLFDQKLSEGGDPEGGIKIIASLLAKDDPGDPICGLLTHTVEPDNQPEQWAELSRSHNIRKDRFVVIPKHYLSQAPIIFAQSLKFVALSPAFDELKRRTRKIIEDAATAAAKRVDDVNIYDLDYIVFQVAAEEGLWEPDMLFRLHSLFHRLESLRLAHDGALEEVAARLRVVSEIPTSCDLLPPPRSAWALQREELYEFAEHINRNHLPLEVGDIFERVGSNSTKRYILLAQPCDLMVRRNGKRAPERRRVPLAEVVCAETQPHCSEEMPFHSTSPMERWYVKFRLVHFVRVCILDLCVFNQDGVAELIVNSDVPTGIRPAWRMRHKILSRCIGRTVRKAEVLAPVADEPQEITQFKRRQAVRDLGHMFLDDDLFKGELREAGGVQAVKFNCKRVGRLTRARAIGLLMSYTASLARPAYDRDFVMTASDEAQ